jgi:hypothetical protein
MSSSPSSPQAATSPGAAGTKRSSPSRDHEPKSAKIELKVRCGDGSLTTVSVRPSDYHHDVLGRIFSAADSGFDDSQLSPKYPGVNRHGYVNLLSDSYLGFNKNKKIVNQLKRVAPTHGAVFCLAVSEGMVSTERADNFFAYYCKVVSEFEKRITPFDPTVSHKVSVCKKRAGKVPSLQGLLIAAFYENWDEDNVPPFEYRVISCFEDEVIAHGHHGGASHSHGIVLDEKTPFFVGKRELLGNLGLLRVEIKYNSPRNSHIAVKCGDGSIAFVEVQPDTTAYDLLNRVLIDHHTRFDGTYCKDFWIKFVNDPFSVSLLSSDYKVISNDALVDTFNKSAVFHVAANETDRAPYQAVLGKVTTVLNKFEKVFPVKNAVPLESLDHVDENSSSEEIATCLASLTQHLREQVQSQTTQNFVYYVESVNALSIDDANFNRRPKTYRRLTVCTVTPDLLVNVMRRHFVRTNGEEGKMCPHEVFVVCCHNGAAMATAICSDVVGRAADLDSCDYSDRYDHLSDVSGLHRIELKML